MKIKRVILLMGLLALLAVAGLLLLYALDPTFLRAGSGGSQREARIFKPSRPSINYEVFKPAIFLVEDVIFVSDALVDYFRPSNLEAVACDFVPARRERLPGQALQRWLEHCYEAPIPNPL